MIISLLFLGELVGANLPREMPDIDSTLIERYLPIGESSVDIPALLESPNLGSMGFLYALAALDSTPYRDFSPQEDANVFLDIASLLPSEGRITLFKFGIDNSLNITYEGSQDSLNQFTNSLAKTGRFSTIHYSKNPEENSYTIHTQLM